MKKTLFTCHLLFFFPAFAQQKDIFIHEFQLFTGFNNVAWGSTNYHAKATAESVYPEAKNHNWDLSYPPDDDFTEWGFAWYRMPSFYVNAIVGHKLNIPHCYWRLGLNYVSSALSLEDFSGHGTLQHSYVTDGSGNIISYRQSEESMSHSFEITTSKIAVENAFYIRGRDTRSRKSVYAGLSTQLGIATTRYNYSYSRDSWEYDVDSSGYMQELFFSSYDFRGNEKGKTGAYASANLLFGYNRRLGRKPKFTSTHFFTEFKPGFCVLYAPELKAWKTTYNGFWSLAGFRFTFGDEQTELPQGK